MFFPNTTKNCALYKKWEKGVRGGEKAASQLWALKNETVNFLGFLNLLLYPTLGAEEASKPQWSEDTD